MTYEQGGCSAVGGESSRCVQCAPVCPMKGFLDLGMGLSLGSCSKDPILEQEGSRVLIFQKSYFLGQLT